MRLYIIRHAETEYNIKGIIQGSEVDSDINNTGQSQSDSFFQYYKDTNFDKIYTSALKRTFQTIRKFTDCKIPYSKLDEFNEISWGINQGKSDKLDAYAELTKSWANGHLDNKFPKGESPNEMSKRLMVGFRKILNENHNLILLCIHGRALRVLLSQIIDNDLSKMDKYIHSNTGLYIIDYNAGNFEVVEKNSRKHLEPKI